jgi:tyrosine-protein phosphatase non-receptor type 9
MPDQYVFCHLGIIQHAMRTGLVKEMDPVLLDDSNSESE